jgi:hypothetical protein
MDEILYESGKKETTIVMDTQAQSWFRMENTRY